MNKKIKILIYFLTFVLISSCSFDKKTGIWSGGQDEKDRISKLEKEQKSIIEVTKVYSSENVYTKELSYEKNISLSNPRKNSAWETSNLNIENNIGNLYLSGIGNNFLKKRIGKNKYDISVIETSPLAYNDNIIFSDDVGTIYKINQRGKVIWRKNIYKKLYKKIYKKLTFAIYKNRIYVADNVGFIYSINLENGKLIWVKNHGVPLKSNIKVFNNGLYVINQDNRTICLDVETGTLIWDIRSVASFIKSQNFLALAISKKGDLVLLNSSGDLQKIKAVNGMIYWTLNALGSLLAHDKDFFNSSDIVISDGDIIFSTSSAIFSYNLLTGSLNWMQELQSYNTPIIDNNNVFTITNNGYLVNLEKDTGKIIRSVNILKNLKKKKRKTSISGFVIGSSKIYATTLNGYLIICSAASGTVESVKKIGDPVVASPIINNGSLYILTSKSKILGFN